MLYPLVRLFIYMLPNGILRTKWITRLHVFDSIGKNFYFCPRKLPADPKLIRFGDNVSVATDVMFINHDVSHKVFNWCHTEPVKKFFGCIEVGNNVFIGARVIILPNVKICDNVFIGAGAVVTKSINQCGIWGGVPARWIGAVKPLYEERVRYSRTIFDDNEDIYRKNLWIEFERKNVK